MTDLIDRQAAIDITLEGFCRHKYVNDALLTARNKIKALPSAQPEQRKGKWIHPYHYGLALPEHECSVCHEWEYADTESKFCPNCGADMRSEKDAVD